MKLTYAADNPQSHQCSNSAQKDRNLYELDKQLQDAVNTENLADFVVNTTLGMYTYLHPCAHTSGAVMTLFYDQNGTELHSGFSHRRRKKRATVFVTDDDLLKDQLDRLVNTTNAGCVQFLIEKYKNISAVTFKIKNPHFAVSTTTVSTTPDVTTTTSAKTMTTTPATTSAKTMTTTPATTMTTTPATTSEKAMTTTPATTMTTTPAPAKTMTTTPAKTMTTSTGKIMTTSISTSRPTTSVNTTVGLTTSQTPAGGISTHSPISCTTCSGLLCLLGSHVNACPNGQFFCLTSVEETTTGRQISRGCVSQALCDGYAKNQDSNLCSRVDHQMLSTGSTCRFCCLGDNCNKPPNVIPDFSTLYTSGAH